MDEAGRSGAPSRNSTASSTSCCTPRSATRSCRSSWAPSGPSRRVAGIRGWTDDPSPEMTVRRHRDIVTALRARDVEAAQRAMADHFRGIEARAAQESRGVGSVGVVRGSYGSFPALGPVRL